MALTRKQTALIHVARKQLGLTDPEYRAILRHMGDVESSRDLDREGFELVMQYMAALGFRSHFTRAFYGHRPGMATPAEVSTIRNLWSEYTRGEAGSDDLDKWLERTFKVSALRFLSRDKARKAIGALRSMNRRVEGEAKRVAATDSQAVARWRYGVIEPALRHPPRSSERVAAIEAAARDERILPSGRGGRIAESTIRRWMLAWERDGLEGLEPKPAEAPRKATA